MEALSLTLNNSVKASSNPTIIMRIPKLFLVARDTFVWINNSVSSDLSKCHCSRGQSEKRFAKWLSMPWTRSQPAWLWNAAFLVCLWSVLADCSPVPSGINQEFWRCHSFQEIHCWRCDGWIFINILNLHDLKGALNVWIRIKISIKVCHVSWITLSHQE